MTKQLDVSSGKLVTIRLYGKLGTKFGRVHRMAVSNMSEAVRALGSQIRGFEAHMVQSKDNGVGYTVFYGKRNLREDELVSPVGDDEIRIAPIMLGSKNGGVFNIILGAVLIVAGTLLALYVNPTLGAAVLNMGIAMFLGGIVQLLTPVPKTGSAKDSPENQPSYAFNGPVNTQAQGNSVSVLYGRLIVGSAVLSAGINVKDQAYIPYNSGVNVSAGGGAPPWQLEGLT